MKQIRVWLLALAPLVAAGCDPSGPAGCITVQGLVVLEAQADVNAMAGVCEITRGLEIRQAAETTDPVTTLAPLSDLRTVGTSSGSALRVLSTTALEGLEGLEKLTLTDDAELRFEDNAALTSLAALGADTAGAVTRVASLHVGANGALVDLTGVGNVLSEAGAEVTGELGVFDNPSMTTLAGLERITGRIAALLVSGLPALGSLETLPDVPSAGTLELSDLPFTNITVGLPSVGYLLIQDNPELTALTIDVPSFGPYLRVWGNGALETLAVTTDRAPDVLTVNQSPVLAVFDLAVADGALGAFSLTAVPALASVGAVGLLVHDRLTLDDTGLTTLDAFTTVPALSDGLILVGNPGLADMESFAALETADRLRIENNTALCVPEWVSGVVATTVSISGNLCD